MNFLLKVVVACAAAVLIPSFVAGALAVNAFDGNSAVMVWTAGLLAFTAMLTFLSVVAAGPILFCLCVGLLVWCFEDIAGDGLRSARRKANLRSMEGGNPSNLRIQVSFVPSRHRS